jgi:6-phospho-beta-glucosidase
MSNEKLKIVVIGGGSSYTPELIEGFINRRDTVPARELWLTDIPKGQKKLEIVGGLAKRMVTEAGCDMEIKTSLDRRETLYGADFVLTQFRVGGLDARINDERIPLKYGCIGQETTGPGGFAKALRTIPVILELCRDMEELCPDAWLINFTNPSGIVTETVLNHTNIKAIGLCNCPISMQNSIAETLNVPAGEVYCDFVGLNHLLWAQRILVSGKDMTEHVVARAHGNSESMSNIPGISVSKEFYKSLGMLPISYLKYYYFAKEMLSECIRESENEGVRGEVVKRVEEELYLQYQNQDLKTKPPQLSERGGAHYSDAACDLIDSIYNDKGDIQVVCVKNGKTNPDLPEDAVIERNCVIGKNGAAPVSHGHMPLKIRGLVQIVKAYEQLTIEAGVNGDYEAALQALTIHPLVPSFNTAKDMLDELISANKEFLPDSLGVIGRSDL